MTLRNRELAALLTVGVLTAIGFATVYIALKSQVSGGSLGYAVFFFGLYLVAHIVARITVPLADPYLLPMAALLTAIGLTEIYRLGPPSNAFRQGLWIVIGVAAFAATLFALHRDYRVLERYKYVFGVTALVLLFLPRLPVIGEPINGSRLWVHVGSLQFQPGELGKIALIVFLAAYLRERREVLAQGRLKDWGPLLAIWGAAMLLLFVTNDLGSALLYYGIFLAMVYIATARVSFVVAALGLFVVGSFAVTQVTPHVQERVDVWLDPYKHAQSSGYQILQSLYSIAHGGFGGTGLGHGIVTGPTGQQVVPDLNTDFIYSALAQELGLVGAAAILLLYMAFVLRGFQIALAATDGFSKLLAAGLSFGFAFQTFVIVGGITRVIPLTGITLPFVSYGGSSVVANFLLVAGLMLISHRANRQEAGG
ncbi:MAG TPA: FtsW/RodA/SpoVE family cell cycle protein [Gaiellaceae bacterium]|jgi:cell division protein FtsW (lipid II flippase)|nr:FtsW/RodA/SpoVE family cell cycle protein [Gaiellaceae bacterium]